MKRYLVWIAWAALATMLTAADKKAPACTEAKVLSQEISSQDRGAIAAPLGNTTVALPIATHTNRVVIQTAKSVLEMVEAGDRFIVLPVDDTAEFCEDKDYLVVLDSKKKKHKFVIVGMRSLPKPEEKKSEK